MLMESSIIFQMSMLVRWKIKDIWNDLASIVSTMTMGWVVGADFNDIIHLNEKMGGLSASLRRCTLFQ